MAESKALETRPKDTALVQEEDWETALRQQAKDEKSSFTAGIPRLTHKNHILYIDGKKVADNRVRVVPIDVVWTKQWFETEYEEGAHDTPKCYAFGKQEKGLVPHPAVPLRQSEQCDGCPHNKFFTAKKGKGKRCQDRPTLVFLLADDVARALPGPNKKPTQEEINKAVQKAAMMQIVIPPASIKQLGQYMSFVEEATPHKNIREAMTEIGTELREEGGGYLITFKFLDVVPREAMPALTKRGGSVFNLVAQPFPVMDGEAKQEVPAANSKPVKGQEPAKKGRR
jgi:hypothetical protein